MNNQTTISMAALLRPYLGFTRRALLFLLLVTLMSLQGAADRTIERPWPNLQGEKAIEKLKEQGLYASLQEAMRAARYAINWSEESSLPDRRGAYGAVNPAQQYTSYFMPDGLHLGDASQADKAWRLEMRLQSVGYGRRLRPVSAAQLSAADRRIEYARTVGDDRQTSLTEWYENGEQGLEQGFTLAAAPGERRAGERLRLEMELSGDLRARASGDGQAIELLRASGEKVLDYEHLEVRDAAGRKLEAAMGIAGSKVWVEVDDAEAEWPVTIDPIFAQQAYLKASNTGAVDQFGWSVAIAGNTAVVGANREDSNATTVNGDQANNSALEAGSAYVFVRSGTTWTQEAYLKASNTDADDQFGYSVAIAGDTIVVGAPGEDSNATTVNGDQTNNSAFAAGAAYVFLRSAGIWSQQAYLKASNAGAFNQFGLSVAIAGDTIVVGANGERGISTGVNGDQTNNLALDVGAAYVFVRSGTAWSQQAYMKASNSEANDNFGWSVAIAGDTIVVGAYREDSNATGVGGNQADNSAPDAGAAYVFFRSAGLWSQQAYLKASNTGADDQFGTSVAIAGDTIVVGAPGEDSNATGVNGDQVNNSATGAGAAYVFFRSGTTWSQQAYLKASNTGADDVFGTSVAIAGDTIVVGAYGEASNATGVNGDQTSNSAAFAGAAYVFFRSAGLWSQQAYLKASNTELGDLFGYSVAIAGDTAVVGAFREDSNATTVNGDQADNLAQDSGAAYVFALDCTITCPPNQSATTGPGATQCCAVVNYPAPTVDAGCGTVTCSPPAGTCFSVGTTTITCSTPAGPNCTFTVTITDNTPPAITCPANVTVPTSPNLCNATVSYPAPAVSDNCSGVGTPTCSPASGSVFQKGTSTVTCSVSDMAGNMASCTFTVTVNDTQNPTITCPANITVSTANACEVVNYPAPAVSDNCPLPPNSVVCSPPSGFCFPIGPGNTPGVTTVTCTVTDASGNMASCSFTVTVVPCTITCPANVTVNTDAKLCTAVVNYPAPTTTSGCGTVICSPSSGSAFPKGTTTVTCTTQTGPTCSFTVTVNDMQQPVLSCPANVSQSSDPNQCQAMVNYPNATATDNCPGVGTPVCTPAAGTAFPKGTTTVTCNVSDASGNAATPCSFTVTINDTQPPTISCPANISTTTAAGQCSAAVNYPNATATDNCSGVGTPSCSPASGSTFLKGTTTVTCTVQDASKNSSNCTFTITVIDNQPPMITCPPNQVRSTNPNQCQAVVTYPAPTVTDNCPGATAVCSPASGSTFPKGVTTVTCTATDAVGSTANCMFTVTVNDTQPPVITCPGSINTMIPSGNCVLVNYTAPVATDNCPMVMVVCTPPSGSCFPVGTTTVSCTATDMSGNTASCSFTVSTFDICIQNDSNASTVILINSATGAYRFCCDGQVYTGVGTIKKQGLVTILEHNPATRRVYAKVDKSTFIGTGYIQQPPGTSLCAITDRDIRNNTCNCP